MTRLIAASFARTASVGTESEVMTALAELVARR